MENKKDMEKIIQGFYSEIRTESVPLGFKERVMHRIDSGKECSLSWLSDYLWACVMIVIVVSVFSVIYVMKRLSIEMPSIIDQPIRANIQLWRQIIILACGGLSFLLSLFIRSYSLRRI